MAELSIKLKIGNREYPMKVAVEEEATIRQAGKRINDKILSYQKQFGIEDKQDLLAMAAIDTFVENMKKEASLQSIDEVAMEQLSKLNRLISAEL